MTRRAAVHRQSAAYRHILSSVGVMEMLRALPWHDEKPCPVFERNAFPLREDVAWSCA
jgi:hypothetical protein